AQFATNAILSTPAMYFQLHLGKIIPNWYRGEFEEVEIIGLRLPGYQLAGGAISISDAPGLGWEVDEAIIDRHARVISRG
ncbi:MAG: hypothetical protein AAF206_23840, partial [Bacteroidota bacterium]